MENLYLIVGKDCMESSQIILFLSAKYSLLTTEFAAEESVCLHHSLIENIVFSPEEMMEFARFLSENKCLQQIGFAESSMLFIARRRSIKIAVTDVVTQRVCSELGVETINIKRADTKLSNTISSFENSHVERLNIFKIAACL